VIVDGLTDNERAVAWLTSWHPSFEGKAIVNADLTFRAVSPQFCKMLGVSPAELIGSKFHDITPEPVKTLELKNANLVKKGVITNYLLPKTFELFSGRRIEVTILTTGAYHQETEKFMFFVMTIMEKQGALPLRAPSQTQSGLLTWVDKRKVGTTIALMLTSVAAALTKFLWSKL
jgi:PAS domain S-box-containing protein